MKHLETIHRGLFYLFIVLWPLSIKKVLYYYPVQGGFNEFVSIALYASDIALLGALSVWLIFILCNTYSNSSIVIAANCSTWNKIKYITRKMFHVEQNKNISFYTQVIHSLDAYLLIALVLLTFTSTIWSISPIIAIFRSFTLLKIFILYLYIRSNVPRGTFFITVLWITIASATVHALFAIGQFMVQHSLGLYTLRESLITQSTTGVAKLSLFGETYIRAYGLLPHPNILGGFLLFSIGAIIIVRSKLFHVEQNTKYSSINCSTWNNLLVFFPNNVPRGTLLSTVFIIQSFALFITFSKTAILGYIILLSAIYFVPRGTISFRKITNCSTWNNFLMGISVPTIGFFLILAFVSNNNIAQSLQERLIYLNVSRGTFFNNPFLGVGAGQYVVSMANTYTLAHWQYQPVHNVFLLILNELGIIGIFIFILFLNTKFKIVPRGTISYEKRVFFILLLAFIPAMLFDHYLWDIQQGIIMLFLLLSLL